VKPRKRKRKTAITKSRTKPPELFVKIVAEKHGDWYARHDYARAYISVKAGKYQYLKWRDGDQVKSLYLGVNRNKIKIS
jgi:hypothetical protein